MPEPNRGLTAALLFTAAFSLIVLSPAPLAAGSPEYGYLIQAGPALRRVVGRRRL